MVFRTADRALSIHSFSCDSLRPCPCISPCRRQPSAELGRVIRKTIDTLACTKADPGLTTTLPQPRRTARIAGYECAETLR